MPRRRIAPRKKFTKDIIRTVTCNTEAGARRCEADALHTTRLQTNPQRLLNSRSTKVELQPMLGIPDERLETKPSQCLGDAACPSKKIEEHEPLLLQSVGSCPGRSLPKTSSSRCSRANWKTNRCRTDRLWALFPSCACRSYLCTNARIFHLSLHSWRLP